MMQGYTNKVAKAETIISLYNGKKEPLIYLGEVYGKISETPKGSNGFGWDDIFIPENSTLTFAEMDGMEKDQYSMRKMALEKIKMFFQ